MSAAVFSELPFSPPGKQGWPWMDWVERNGQANVEPSLLPKVSVIIPNLNHGDFLEGTIRSVVLQRYPDLELIVIDGASADHSVEIIRKYEKYIDYWISEPDQGVYDGYNKGILASKGEWLFFLGAGDILLDPYAVVRILVFAGSKDVLYGNAYWGRYGKVFGGRFSKWRLIKHNLCHQTMFYRRSLFESFGLFEAKYPIFSDWVFNMKCFGDKRIRICYVDTMVAFYKADGRSHTDRLRDHTFWREKPALVIKNFGFHYLALAWLKSSVLDRLKSYLGRLKKLIKATAVYVWQRVKSKNV